MDTLCVPLYPNHARNLAIIAMKQTYEEAAVVLVLDLGLMQHALPDSPLEIFARIAVSNWNRRLWTFQEAAMSARIHFRFRNACTFKFTTNQESISPSQFNLWKFLIKNEGEEQKASLGTHEIQQDFYFILSMKSATLQEEWTAYERKSLALICRDDMYNLFSSSSQTMTRAALVSVVKEQEGIIYAKFMCSAQLVRHVDADPQNLDTFTPGSLLAPVPDIGNADYVDSTQMWCVG